MKTTLLVTAGKGKLPASVAEVASHFLKVLQAIEYGESDGDTVTITVDEEHHVMFDKDATDPTAQSTSDHVDVRYVFGQKSIHFMRISFFKSGLVLYSLDGGVHQDANGKAQNAVDWFVERLLSYF